VELAHIQEFVWDTEAPADENSQRLLNLLRTEPEFVEQHSELLRRALGWKRSGKAAGELLSHMLLRRAEQWLKDVAVSTSPEHGLPRPRATRLISRYVQESRRRFNRRFRFSVAVGLLTLLTLAGSWGWVTSTPYQFLQIERESPDLVSVVLNDPREPRRDEVLAQYVAALAAHGNVQEAVAAAQRTREPGERASAQARIVEALSRAGALDEARQVRDQIDTSPSGIMSPRAPAEVLIAASEASFARGEGERAKQELRVAVELAGAIEAQGGKSAALEIRAPVFARILAARVRQREISEALTGLSSIGDPDRREATLVRLVEIAADLWAGQDVLPLARALSNRDERAMVLGSAARRLRDRGLHADADALEDEALDAVQGSQDPLALAQVGRWLAARKPALAEQTLLAARDVARRQNRVDERLLVAVGFTEHGRRDEAAIDIREALALMNSEPYERHRLLDGLVRVGETDLARKLAGDSPDDLLQLVTTLVELGRLDEAVELAPRIQGESEQSSAFYALAHALTARSEYRRARDYAARCRPIERMTAYSELLMHHSPR
jgi:tetratricopeptide (TPR) repeat protein